MTRTIAKPAFSQNIIYSYHWHSSEKRDLDRPEKWAYMKLLQFSKAQVLSQTSARTGG